MKALDRTGIYITISAKESLVFKNKSNMIHDLKNAQKF